MFEPHPIISIIINIISEPVFLLNDPNRYFWSFAQHSKWFITYCPNLFETVIHSIKLMRSVIEIVAFVLFLSSIWLSVCNSHCHLAALFETTLNLELTSKVTRSDEAPALLVFHPLSALCFAFTTPFCAEMCFAYRHLAWMFDCHCLKWFTLSLTSGGCLYNFLSTWKVHKHILCSPVNFFNWILIQHSLNHDSLMKGNDLFVVPYHVRQTLLDEGEYLITQKYDHLLSGSVVLLSAFL